MQLKRILFLYIFISHAFFGACALARTSSGFVVEEKGFTPHYLANDSAEDIKIASPENITIIVYSHGTTRSFQTEDCDADWNKVPKSLLSLSSDQVKIYYLCSNASDNDGVFGGYVYKRAKEITQVVNELIKQGVDSRRIFLSGHSAGAWSSLMSRVNSTTEVGGLILFAPAFGGRKNLELTQPVWRQTLRPKQASEIVTAQTIRAIIFSYFGDPFGEPDEISFITKAFPTSTEHISYSCFFGVSNPHLTHLNDCEQRKTSDRIFKFISK